MAKIIDLTGKRFGKWTVLHRAEDNRHGAAEWLCRCDCGREKPVDGRSLRKGGSKSCGRRECHYSWKGGRNPAGYVLLSDPDHANARANGVVFEHTKVMSEHLGRPLLPKETVHHKNGVRDDNRIENLELWSSNHPSGQRVSDMTEFCKQFLEQYEPEALK